MSKPKNREQMFEQVRAIKTIGSSLHRNQDEQEAVELAGFMALFHPDYDQEKVAAMVRDKRRGR